MSQKQKAPEADDSAQSSDQKAKRKRYIEPAFRFERIFVTTALSCGKTPSSPELTCQTNKKVS